MSNEIVGLINITTGVGVPNADTRYTLITTTQAISAGLDSRLSNVENNYATKATPNAGTYNNVVVNTQGIVTSGGTYNYALDNVVVHKTNNETINGIKTFNNQLLIPAFGNDDSTFNFVISGANALIATSKNIGINQPTPGAGGTVGVPYALDIGTSIVANNGNLRSWKYILGTDMSIVPITNNQSGIGTWWGLQLVGNRRSAVDTWIPSQIGSANDSYGIIMTAGANPSTAIVGIRNNDTYVGSLLRLENNNGTLLTNVDTSGNVLALGSLTSSTLAGVSGALVVHDINGKLLDTGVLYTSLATDSNVVHLAGTETITGLKTFSNNVSAAGYYSSLMNGTISNIFNAQQEPTGFENRTDSTLTFTASDRTFKITGTYNIYIKGVKYTKNGETQQITNSIGQHYFYYNSSGVFTYSFGTPWSILASDVMIAMVYWDGTNGILVEERHGITMDQVTHYYLHSVNGTQRVSGFGISGITPQGNTDNTNSYAVAAGVLADEDIIFTTTAQTEGGPYNLAVRTGPNGDWTWGASGTPYHYSGNNIQYNQNTGTTWQLTNLTTSNTYVNYYVIAATSVSGSQSFFIVPGQAIYNSLNNAQGESWETLSKGNFPFVEFNAVYQITYRFNNGYATTGRARTEATPVLLSISRASAAAFGSHDTLGGLQGGIAGEYYHLTADQYIDYISKTEVTSVSGSLDSRLSNVETNYANKVTQTGGTFNNITVNTQGVVTSGGNINYAILSSLALGTSGNIVIHDASGYMKDSGTPITSLAVDDNVVHKTGNESIAGVKTLTNRLVTTASVVGAAGINIPHGTKPTSFSNGDVWSTTTGFFGRINGNSVPLSRSVNTLTYAATVTVDSSLGGIQSVTLTGNAIIGNPTNGTDGANLLFRVIQGGTGSYVLTWSANFQFSTSLPQPTLSTSVGSVDYIGFVYYASSGKWHCISYTPFGYN